MAEKWKHYDAERRIGWLRSFMPNYRQYLKGKQLLHRFQQRTFTGA